jgi:hypothetical protein
MEKSPVEISEELLQSKIYIIRGRKVMFDRDLALLYGVKTKNLNKAVTRNIKRFPSDFMFQLTNQEAEKSSRFQTGTLKIKQDRSRSHIVILKRGQNIKYLPYVFTEQGVAMLSSVLHSDRAINVNIQIMRMFAKLREMIMGNEELRNKVEALEHEQKEKFKMIFNVLQLLLKEDETPKGKMGFKTT